MNALFYLAPMSLLLGATGFVPPCFDHCEAASTTI
jgi:hypothetical protein